MKPIEECRRILEDPNGYVKGLKAASGRKIVGTFCSYAPEEIICAAGAHPLRLFGSGEKPRLAEAHLQSTCCSLVRGALEEGLSGRLDFLDGVVFPHTCDSIQRLSDLWRMNVPTGFHLDVVLPVTLATESARQYMVDVLHRFRRELGEKLGLSISEENLRTAIVLYNRIRGAWARIDALRGRRPELLAGGDLFVLSRAATLMERGRLAGLLESVAGELEQKAAQGDAAGSGGVDAAAAPSVRKRIVLSGGVCSHPDLYSIVEEAGGEVAGDDLCTGARALGGQIGEESDPVAAIARRYWERAICPAKHRGLSDRADGLVRLVRERQARGVVFFLLKFCDPHAFDVPTLKASLDRAGIPSLYVEVEEHLPADGQLRTRFEAFVEMI